MAVGALIDKLRMTLDCANGDTPDGYPNEPTGQKRLVRALERLVPAFWDLDIEVLAQIIEMEGRHLPGRVMNADPQALGLEIRRQRPQYQIIYQDPEYREQLRIRNTPFEELIEQGHPGLLCHVLDFVERLQILGLKSEYEIKRRTNSVETVHAGIVVRFLSDTERTTILSVSGSGKIICRSVQTGPLKPFFTNHVIALSSEFDCSPGYDHEEWLLTSEEMQNIINGGTFSDLEKALVHNPNFAPFVAVDISIVFPDRADRWNNLVEQLLHAIEQGVPMLSGLRVTRSTKPSKLDFGE